MVPALANGEVFAAARRKAHLGVLAAVGGPADAFVESMARAATRGLLTARGHLLKAIIERLRGVVGLDTAALMNKMMTGAFHALGANQGGQLCVMLHLTHAWPRASSAAGEARRDARGGGRDQPSAGGGARTLKMVPTFSSLGRYSVISSAFSST